MSPLNLRAKNMALMNKTIQDAEQIHRHHGLTNEQNQTKEANTKGTDGWTELDVVDKARSLLRLTSTEERRS